MALLICIGVAFLLARLFREEESRASRGSLRTARHGQSQPIPSQSEATRHTVSPDKPSSSTIGILVSPSQTWKWQPSFAKAAKWMGEWGLGRTLVAAPGVTEQVLREVCKREGIAPEVLSFDRAVSEVGAMLLPPGLETSADVLRTLKSYAETGGWLVIPEEANIVSQLLGIPERRTAKLNSLPGSYILLGRRTATEARPLVSHPVLAGFACREWLSAETLSGEAAALSLDRKAGLLLMLFKNPSAEGVEVIPVKEGGIVHLNWELYDGGQIGSKDAREVLRNVLVWLSHREMWLQPQQQPAFAVAGKVVDTEDGPVREATVKAKVFTDWGSLASEVQTLSAEDGSFSLSAFAPSVYQFEVSAEGYGQEDPFVMAQCEFGSDAEPTTIRMRRTVALYGTVRYGSDAGAAAPDFPVQLIPADRDVHSQPQKAITDARGEFVFKKVEHGRTILLTAEKDEWVGMKVVELPLVLDEKPERVDLAVFQVPEIRGKVTDGETEQPIPHAKVKAEPLNPEAKIQVFQSQLTRLIETDDEAKFLLRLSPGRWNLEPEAEGYITWYRELERDDRTIYDRGRAEITVSVTSPKEEVVLKLEKFRFVRFFGTVYFPSGEPAAGARVVVDASPGASQGVYITDAIGRYTTDPIPRFTLLDQEEDGVRRKGPITFWFAVRCEQFAISELAEFEEVQEEMRRDFWLQEGISISGFVRDAKANAVEGATVFPMKLHTTAREGHETLSAADGSFTLHGFAKTIWNSKLRAEKTVKTESGSVLYAGEVLPGYGIRDEAIQGVEIVIARAGELSGRLLYHDGTPVRNALVSFTFFYTGGTEWSQPGLGTSTPPSTLLNDAGEFRIEMPSVYQLQRIRWRDRGRDGWREPEQIPADAGKWDIVVSKRGGFEDGVIIADSVVMLKGVEAGTSDLEIRLPPLATITARVVDASTGEPIEKLDLQLSPEDEQVRAHFGFWGGTPERYPDGRVRIERIVPRVHNFRVRGEGYREATVSGLDVRPGETLDLGQIALARSWGISGKVVDSATGQPLAATVKAGSDTKHTMEDEEEGGLFWFELSPTPELEIEIIPDDDRWQPTTLRVTYDGKPEIHLGDIPLPRRQN